MSRRLDMPEGLQAQLTRSDDGLAFTSAVTHPGLATAGLVSAALFVVIGLVLIVLFPVAIACFAVGALCGGVGIWLGRKPDVGLLTDHGLTLRGLLGSDRIDRAERVRIEGLPPGPVRVSTVGPDRRVLDVMPTETGWTLEELTWFAEALAESLGAQVQDHRDTERWAAWRLAEATRAQAAFAQRQAQSHRTYARLHALDPLEPKGVAYAHDHLEVTIRSGGGMMRTLKPLRFSDTALSLGGLAQPLAEIVDARLVFSRTQRDRHDEYPGIRAELVALLTNGRMTTLIWRAVEDDRQVAQHLLWLAAEIRQRAGRPDGLGDASDVPDTLKDLV